MIENASESKSLEAVPSVIDITAPESSRLQSKKMKFNDWLSQTQQSLSRSMDEVSRVMEMIRHFRDVAASAKAVETSASEASIHDSVFQVIRAMQYEFPLRSITVLKILPHDLGPFPMRPEHLEALLFELVYRSREALLGKPGVITIEVQKSHQKPSENQRGTRYVIRVSDNGQPIHPDELPTIFESEMDEMQAAASKGMKLALVKKIIDFYQGAVRIETSCRGTSVFVEVQNVS